MKKLLRKIDIGGKIVSIIEDKDFYYLLEGKREINKFVKKYITKDVLWKVTNDYILYLKKMQDEFEDTKLPIDTLVAKAEKEIEKEFTKRLRAFFKTIPQTSSEEFIPVTNKEAFLSSQIFSKLGKAFVGFNSFINNVISSTLKDLSIEVTDDVDDTGYAADKDIKKILNDKKKIMQKNIAASVIGTKDSILNNIKQDISAGMLADNSTTTIQKDIEKKYNYRNGVGWKSKRIIRDNLHNANILLKLNKWKNMGFVQFEWLTRNDSRVRPSHKRKNHRVFNIKKALLDKKNMDAYPSKNYGCRCTAIPYS